MEMSSRMIQSYINDNIGGTSYKNLDIMSGWQIHFSQIGIVSGIDFKFVTNYNLMLALSYHVTEYTNFKGKFYDAELMVLFGQFNYFEANIEVELIHTDDNTK